MDYLKILRGVSILLAYTPCRNGEPSRQNGQEDRPRFVTKEGLELLREHYQKTL